MPGFDDVKIYLKPGQSVRFDGRIAVNTDDSGFYIVDVHYTEEDFHEKVRNKPYYLDFTEFNRSIIDKDFPTTDSEKKRTLYSVKRDPFDVERLISVKARYIMTIINLIYEKNRKFHIRALYYALIQKNLGWPYRDNVSMNTVYFRKYGTKRNDYSELSAVVSLLRYIGILPYQRIYDERVTRGIEGYIPRSAAGKEVVRFVPQIDAEIKTNLGNIEIPVKMPIVILYTEKSEMYPVFRELSKRYMLAYYVGNGEISVTGAKRIYDFIKERSDKGVILTFTDYDVSGLQMPLSITRKIQYFIESDGTHAPSILIHRMSLSPDEVEALKSMGIPAIEKKHKRLKKCFRIYELIAADVLAMENGLSLADYYDIRMTAILNDILITRETYQRKLERTVNRIKKKILRNINRLIKSPNIREAIIKEINPVIIDDKIKDFDYYIDSIVAKIESLESYKVLKNSIKDLEIKIEPIKAEVEKIEDAVADILDSLDTTLIKPYTYAETTEKLIDFRERKIDMLDICLLGGTKKSKKKKKK